MKIHAIILFFVFLSCIKNPTHSSKELKIKDVYEIKKKRCVLIHAWASWCPICIKELPEIVNKFNEEKKITPIIIDLSGSFVHENFSKKWLTNLNAKFLTYYKSGEDQMMFFKAIDESWNGELPYTVYYDNGVKKKEWRRGFDVNRELETLECEK